MTAKISSPRWKVGNRIQSVRETWEIGTVVAVGYGTIAVRWDGDGKVGQLNDGEYLDPTLYRNPLA